MKFVNGLLLLSLLLLLHLPSTTYANDSLNVSMCDQVFDFWNTVDDVETFDHYAYVVGCNSGLHILDITNPSSPEIIGFEYLWEAYEVKVFGDMAIIFSNPFNLEVLNLYDITDPVHPVFISSIEFDRSTRLSFYIEGNYLYVSQYAYPSSEEDSEIRIYDITDPYHPALFSVFSYGDDEISDILLSDGKMSVPHVMNETDFYLSILDISDPSVISEISDTQISAPTNNMHALRIIGDSNTVYFSADDDLWIIDVSDPENVAPLGSLTVEWDICEIELRDHYLISVNNLQMRVIDIADPTEPVEVNLIQYDRVFSRFSILGEELYVLIGPRTSLDPRTNSLLVLNISDEMNISVITTINNRNNFSEMKIWEDHLFVTSRYSNNPILVDIADPENLEVLEPMNLSLYNFFIYEDRLFDFCTNSLNIYYISDPTDPRFLYSDTNPLALEYLYQHNDYYLGIGNDSEDVFYVMELNSPYDGFDVVSSIDKDDLSVDYFIPAKILAEGNYVYLVGRFVYYEHDDEMDLMIFELNERGGLTEICTYGINEFNYTVASHIAISGNYIYLAGDDIFTIDVTDPAHPNMISTLETHNLTDMCVGDNNLYCATEDGLTVIDINNPAEPFETGYYHIIHNQSRFVQYQDGIVYLASHQLLRSYDVSQTLAVEGEQNHLEFPTGYTLANAYPNPFNPTLNIRVTLPEAASLRVSITNILGREVALLSDQAQQAGYHHFIFDGSDLSSGIYFIRAKVDGKMDQVQKVMLLK